MTRRIGVARSMSDGVDFASAVQSTTLQPSLSRKAFYFFIVAAVLVFVNITLLSFLEVPLFFVALIFMHVGIAFFVVSKRLFRKAGFDVQVVFKTQYILLVPYLGSMIWSLLSRAELVPALGTQKTILVLVWTVCCIVATVFNCKKLRPLS